MKLCRCVHVLKLKRITNPKHRYNAHCAPLTYRYFRPTHVIGGEENCFWESKSAHKPVIIMSLWSLNTEHVRTHGSKFPEMYANFRVKFVFINPNLCLESGVRTFQALFLHTQRL